MKILIAPDSFKDSLSARKAAECIYDGMKKVFTESLFDLHPMADGGEGTIQAIQNSSVGRKIQVRVHDPLMREIESFFVYLEEEKTAIIEMSLASGLELLKPEERNPWLTTTYGTGELIKAALDTGCLKIIIAIGGSATNDAGAGMAAALGAGFYDLEKHPVIPAGGTLDQIVGVDLSGLDKRINCVSILVACDVTNPLFGPTGASMVYARQKGADSTMAEKLDKNLISFSKLLEEKEEIQNMPGAGAAGGLGFGLVTFLNARIVKGFDLISEITGLEKKIEWADLVITGEGKTDSQTLYGKTIVGVARLAKKYSKPVIVISGAIEDDSSGLYELGIDAMVSICDKPLLLEESMNNAEHLLENAAERVSRLLQTGKHLTI